MANTQVYDEKDDREEVIETLNDRDHYNAKLRTWGRSDMICTHDDMGVYEVQELERRGYSLYHTSNGTLIFK